MPVDEEQPQHVEQASSLGDAFTKFVGAGDDKTTAAFISLASDVGASYTGIGTAADLIKFALDLSGIAGSGTSQEELMSAQLDKIRGLLQSQITNSAWLEASRDATSDLAQASDASQATRVFDKGKPSKSHAWALPRIQGITGFR